MTQTPIHYTLFSLEDGKVAGCSLNKLPDKVIETLKVRMEISNREECTICDGEEDQYL